MADKASRGLVLYGDGSARFINPSHNNLHSLASLASSAFLSLPQSPPSESEDERTIRELAELLDAGEAYKNVIEKGAAKEDCQENCLIPTISERFMGMRAAIVTNHPGVKFLGGKLGFTVLQLNDLIDGTHPFSESPLDVVSTELLKLLGFQEGKASETGHFDLVFVHIGPHAEENGQKDIEKINALVGGILSVTQPGSEIGCRLHVSVVLSYGAVSVDDDPSLSISVNNQKNNCDLSLLFPRQSYIMKEGNLRENVRHHCPMLMAQCQSAVTRKDMVETFSFQDIKEHGGNLTIPADRFLHELAFKLWKAPKYGA